VASDVVTNDISQEGRLVVVLMDRTIRSGDTAWARRIASTAIDRLGPDDLGAVVYSLWGTPQNFTTDRQRLLAAIQQPFVGGTLGAVSPAECRCGLCTLETMTTVADALRDVPQRRKILFFIGRVIPIQSQGDCGGLVREARQTLLRSAQVANLTIHVIDPSGLEGFLPDASLRAPGRGGQTPAMRNMIRQGNLSFFPEATGGRTVLNANGPQDQVFGILRESSSYYVIGFEPGSRNEDGRFHEIKVKVKRPDVTVQSRRGYYAPGGKSRPVPRGAAGASPSLVDAVVSLWPRKAVALSVSAAPFATPAGAAAAIAVRARQDEAGVVGTVDVLAGAFDRFGRSTNFQRQTVAVSPPPNERGEFEYEILARLPVEPGRYEIRVALEDASRSRTGSVYTYVDVPDFAKEPLSLSGIVVEARPSVPSAPAVAFADLLPVTPGTRRVFTRSETATAFLRAYQSGSRGLGAVTISARIRDDTDRVVYQQTTSIRGSEFAGDRSADWGLDLPLDLLKPGEHLLTIVGMSGTSQVQRQLRFTVR
jgi:VWFA-related protein